MKVLLTNDDSHRSPLLEFAIEFLSARYDLKIVVPQREQSWRGKMITRYERLHFKDAELFGHPAVFLDGSPADCSNFGIYHAFEGEKPDLVVSGINAGLNTGVCFVLSSGTVGACFEANIAGVPGIALSQQFDETLHRSYSAEYVLPEDEQTRLHEQTRGALERVFEYLEPRLEPRITWNVNFPVTIAQPTTLTRTKLGKAFYRNLFLPENGALKHSLKEIDRDDDPEIDMAALDRKEISITKLAITDLCNQSLSS